MDSIQVEWTKVLNEKRLKYKTMEINFVESPEFLGVMKEQKSLMVQFIANKVYPDVVELYQVDNDFGLILWYDERELIIDTGLCTELLCDVICNHVPIHLAIYKELDILTKG